MIVAFTSARQSEDTHLIIFMVVALAVIHLVTRSLLFIRINVISSLVENYSKYD
jgi:uncharacterized protein HemY